MEKTIPDQTLSRSGPPAAEPAPIVLQSDELIAYRVTDWPAMKLVPAARTRQWMDNTRDRFANRCLPLLMANQSGWWVLNSHPIRATWTGGWDPTCVRIQSFDGTTYLPVSGHFGEGVITFNLPFLFRTPRGVNLHARGPANLPKDGIVALEGIIETDWSCATFTMNWKFTRPNVTITFEKDEPICMVVPHPRGYLESIRPSVRDVREDDYTSRGFAEWSKSRTHFIKSSRIPNTPEFKEGWQKHYFRGIDMQGTPAPEHQSKLGLAEFTDGGPALYPPLPDVKAHPQALDALRRLAAGQLDTAEAMQHIAYFVHSYLHQYAASSHGSMIGALMCRALFPAVAAQSSLDEMREQWERMRQLPFDGLATESGAATFAIAAAAASSDPNIEKGKERLWEEKLKAILPPPPEVREESC